MKLDGLRIILTGASSGLGLCLLHLLIERGSVINACARHKNDEITNVNGNFYFHLLDLSNPINAKDLIQTSIEKDGGIDVLINNAGVSHQLKTVENLIPDDITYTFSNNVFSIFNTLRYAVPIMKSQNKGIIINISSRCSRRAVPRLSAYCASKFAVRGLTEAVAKEVEGTNIKCISISPTGINTAMRRNLFGEDDANNQQDPKRVADIICKIIQDDIQVPNGADVVILREGHPQVKVPES